MLDAGCGDGFLAARLAGRVPHVVGLDVDGPVLGRAAARFPDAGVSWVRADVAQAPFAPGSFDALVSNAALHHLPDPAAALTALAATLRPGGTLAFVTLVRLDLPDLPWQAAAAVAEVVAARRTASGSIPLPSSGRRRTPDGSWNRPPGR